MTLWLGGPVEGAWVAVAEAAQAVGEGEVQLAAREPQVVTGRLEGGQVAQVVMAGGEAGVVQDPRRTPLPNGKIIKEPHPPAIRDDVIRLEQQLSLAGVVILPHMVSAVDVMGIGKVAIPLAV